MIKTANISGAGIGGLTAAIALAQKGVEVSIFEQASEMSEVGAGLQLSPNAMRVLARLGLLDSLEPVAFAPEKAVIKNGLTGCALVSVPLSASKGSAFDHPYFHVHRADLQEILLAAANSLGVSTQLGRDISAYDECGFLGVGRADISIAADGLRSLCAQQMHPDIPTRFTGQVAWRGTLLAKEIEAGLIPPDATAWVGPGQHIVTYYVRAGEIVNFVAVEEKRSWESADWSTVGDVADLRSAFSGWHDTIGAILGQANTVNVWALFDKPPLPGWFSDRTVLLGDACHPTLPFLAQGAAMAIEDAYVLTDCLDRKEGVAEAFAHYEALRKPRTSMLQAKARNNARLFHLTGPFGGLVPRAKLAIAGRLPNKLQSMPFRQVYSYDATNVVD